MNNYEIINDLYIQPLTLEYFTDWLTLTHENKINHKAQLQQKIDQHPQVMRYLVMFNGKVCARFSIEVDHNILTCWWPTYWNKLTREVRKRVNRKVCQFILSIYHQQSVKLIDCRLKRQNKIIEDWYLVLIEFGFKKLSTKHEYRLVCQQSPVIKEPKICNAQSIELFINFVDEPIQPAIYRRVQEHTLDKEDRFEAKHGLELHGYNKVLYISESGNFIGYHALAIESDEVWTISFGVHPAWRDKGLGRYLFISGMQYSYVMGGRVFKSLIDIDNIPSIQIHESLGFEKGNDAISCLIYE